MADWFVVLHTAGPAIAQGQEVFDHPSVAEHLALLWRVGEAGRLIAAGLVRRRARVGMTVIEADDLADAERLATTDDQAVVTGVLDVRVRPWNVSLGSALRAS